MLSQTTRGSASGTTSRGAGHADGVGFVRTTGSWLIGSVPKRPAATGTPRAPLPEGADPRVETPVSREMVELATAALDSELKARDGFRSRLVGLLAFGGALLALTVNVGRESLHEDLGRVGKPAFFAILLLIAILLVISLVRTVEAVRPQEQARFSTARLIELGYQQDVDEAGLRRRVYRVTAQVADQEGARNDQRGKELDVAVRPLRSALILAAGEVLILCLHAWGV